MSFECPECNTWTIVKHTRNRRTLGSTYRRYECANGHRFSTEEKIKNELLRRQRELQPGTQLPSEGDKSESAIPQAPSDTH